MNRKGFTLVELLATVIVLAAIIGITVPLALGAINKSKEHSETLFLKDIKTAVVNLITECGYDDELGICEAIIYDDVDNEKSVTLRKLAEFGFLSFTETEEGDFGDIIVRNPKTNDDVSLCRLKVKSSGAYCWFPFHDSATCGFLPSCLNGFDE